MRIIVDAFGGDNAPHDVVLGSFMAVKKADVDVILVGDEAAIKDVISKNSLSSDRVTIVDAKDVIDPGEDPTSAVRSKKDSSMVKGMIMLKDGVGDGFVSAGNTGAIATAATLYIKRIKGIRRAALAPVIPNDVSCAMLIDAGANTECKPEFYLQFGIMGSVYMQNVVGVQSPRVGLVNIGTEDKKGTDLTREAHRLLSAAPINFTGNLEAREIPFGAVDVIVCDGFTGNVILKLIEGMAKMMYGNIKKIFTKNLVSKLGAVLVSSGLREFKAKMDYSDLGGAPFLGIDGVVIKAHGNSNAREFCAAIIQAHQFAATGVNDKIKEVIAKIGNSGDED